MPVMVNQNRILACGVSMSEDRGVAGGGGEKMLDGGERRDAAAGADAGAIERGGGASEIKLLLQGPALQKRVDEAGMEQVAGSGGVHGVNLKGRRVVKLRAVPREHAVGAERGGREAADETFVHGRERFLQIIRRRELARNVAAGDEVIHVGQKRFDARIQLVEVGDDRNAGGARPSRGLGGGCRVVAVKMKRARSGDPVALKLFGAEREAMVTPPKHGALAGVVNKNERLLARAFGGSEKMRLDAEARKFRGVERGRAVSADLADVARAESPLLACDDGGGGLPAGQNRGRTNFDFGAARGIVRDGDQRVGGVEAHADEVDAL